MSATVSSSMYDIGFFFWLGIGIFEENCSLSKGSIFWKELGKIILRLKEVLLHWV